MNTKEPKLYYVIGRDDYGQSKTVKTYAHTVREARSNASWQLVSIDRVQRL